MTHTRKISSESDQAEIVSIVDGSLYKNTPPLEKLKLKPTQQSRISVRNFSGAPAPRGFAIHISPEPEPSALVTQVTHLGNAKAYELVLMIANYGTKAFTVEVWQL